MIFNIFVQRLCWQGQKHLNDFNFLIEMTFEWKKPDKAN